jgi:CRISPR-associated endonuclease/helicase Cas3
MPLDLTHTVAAPRCNKKPSFVAHVRAGGEIQSVESHLRGVSQLAGKMAEKFGLPTQGALIGLLHDLGKYSAAFQAYIQSATGLLNQDEDEEFVNAAGLKGKIDHSSSGAQWIWLELSQQGDLERIAGQVMALCIASHHSGLIDCLSQSSGKPTEDTFTKRMNKPADRTYLSEVVGKADKQLLETARDFLKCEETTKAFQSWVVRILGNIPDADRRSPIFQQQLGLLVRSLFSCLIDADRIDSADFEHPGRARRRLRGQYEGWNVLIDRLEAHLSAFTPQYPIDALRQDISHHCLDGAKRGKGIYTLTVPTGGGKTLASLRFALHHALKHGLDRIVYVIPFTSIIDQNAQIVRDILEPVGVEAGSVVLEHHSNLTPENQSWRSKMLSENWDAPVVYTTSVQLLETLFGAGTRGARRMHQLANAVLIFDEIQSLPINCVHLFNNAMNYLADFCGSTLVLCTATQPLLDQVDKHKGAIRVPLGNELMPNVKELFDDLNRVEVVNRRKPGGWSQDEIATLAFEQIDTVGSCLVIVNTKKAAQDIYRLCKDGGAVKAFHLSTNMCPAHRKLILSEVRARLDQVPTAPTLCISTQLIEAGVDVDFGSVIRLTAGLDSIAQAAGRCNRNGRTKQGLVHVLNPRTEDENLGMLPDIQIGRDKAERVLDDYEANPGKFGNNRIGPEAMAWYYTNYFYARANEMAYPISAKKIGHDDTLLNLLSNNSIAVGEYRRTKRQMPAIYLRQAFKTAAEAFEAIDAPTRGVIVPFGEDGKELINNLCAAYLPDKEFELLRRAQQFSVNVFPNVLEKLSKEGVVQEIRKNTGILYLTDSRYYSAEFGLSETPLGNMEVLYVA